MRFDQYAGHCIVSNFRLHRDSHSQILTATDTPSALTLARSNLICLSSVNWPSWLLLPAAWALSCHLLADHPISLHIVDWHWWKLCPPVFYLCSSFATEIVFSIFAAFPVMDSLLHICLNSSSCHNVFILLSLSGVTNLSLLAGVCAACMLAYICLQMKWWAAVTVVDIPSQKALLMRPYVSAGKFSIIEIQLALPLYMLQPYTLIRWFMASLTPWLLLLFALSHGCLSHLQRWWHLSSSSTGKSCAAWGSSAASGPVCSDIINDLGADAVRGDGNSSLSPGRAIGAVSGSADFASIHLSPGCGIYLPMKSHASYRSASSSRWLVVPQAHLASGANNPTLGRPQSN